MASVVSYAAAVAAVIAAITLALSGLRYAVQQWFFVAALLSLAGSAALSAPATLQLVVQAEPVPHLTRLISAGLAMVGAYCLVGVMLYSTRTVEQARREVRRQTVILVAWFALVAVCLYLSGVPATAVRTPTFSSPVFTAFLVLRFVYTGAATLAFLILINRMIRLPETVPLMRLGFRLAVAATATASLHAVWTVAVNLRIVQAPSSQDFAAELLGVALTMLALGATAPLWGSVLESVLLRRRVWWACRALRRFWADLSVLRARLHVTTMASLPPTIQDRRLSELYRLCIALRDLQRQARPYVHPAVRGWTEDAAQQYRLDVSSTQTLAEAAELGSALDAVRADAPPRPVVGPDRDPLKFVPRVAAEAPADPSDKSLLFADTQRLVCIGFALRHSPLVASIRLRAHTDAVARRPVGGSAG